MAQGDRSISSIAEVAHDNNGAVRATHSLWALCKQYGFGIHEAVRALELGLDIVDVVELMAETADQKLPGGGDLPFQMAVRVKLAALAHAHAGGRKAPAGEAEDFGVVAPPPAPARDLSPPQAPAPQQSRPGLTFGRRG
ncbi:MAG TPA: hypothetical protein VD970_03580 [Acetobacteraceae bacterium]|nr:hypothetical protein [Acetobacteraceae bacterium]